MLTVSSITISGIKEGSMRLKHLSKFLDSTFFRSQMNCTHFLILVFEIPAMTFPNLTATYSISSNRDLSFRFYRIVVRMMLQPEDGGFCRREGIDRRL